MAESKYIGLIKKMSFKDNLGSFQQGIEMGKSFHGLNVHIQYGTCSRPGAIGGGTGETHTHDFDQLLLWLGPDPDNLLELGAEIELCLGKDGERHLFTIPTAVAIPRGVPHFPATIKNLKNPFQYMEISLASEYSASPVTAKGNAETPLAGFMSPNRTYIHALNFLRKGPYFYGSNNAEDSGGVFMNLTGHQTGIELHVSFESIKNAPYTFGPAPHRPHVHKFEEILLFMSPNCRDLNDLDAESEIDMGKEREKHHFAGPAAVVCPEMLPHCPLTVTRVGKPFLFLVVSCAAEHHPLPEKPKS